MGTISDKHTYLFGTKAAIKSAIEAKGVTITEGATFRSYATSIGQITGGSEPTTGDYTVKFYDYNGKLAAVRYVDSGNDATPPTLDERMTLTNWQGDSYTNVTSDRKCYAIGVTTDGKWQFDIELTPITGLQPPLYFINNDDGNSLFIDLGDGSSTVEITQTGNVTHTPTYATYGKYTIKVWKTAGTFKLGDGNNVVIGGSVLNIYKSTLVAVRGGNGTTTIWDNAFFLCHSLASIVIPNSVTSIGDSAFQTCYSLTSITIPDSVKSIGISAFNNCSSLTSITIPDSVMSIGSYALYYCTGLTSITIPDSVTSIGSFTFNNCYCITKYIIHATTPPTLSNTNAFQNINAICKIYVPDASVTAYKNDTNWVTYTDYIYPISEMED